MAATLKSSLNGTFTLGELARLKFPGPRAGTKDSGEAAAEEAELRAFAAAAAEQLQEYYDAMGDGESDYAVRIEAGEVVEIVEA